MPTANSSAAPRKSKGMNKKQLAHFEKRLLDERKRVLKELGRADEVFGGTPQNADGDLSSYSFHMADQGTDAMEREKAFLFASQEGRFLWHIDEALRVAAGDPGALGGRGVDVIQRRRHVGARLRTVAIARHLHSRQPGTAAGIESRVQAGSRRIVGGAGRAARARR